ncbi:MAG: ATP-binding cassette domain-containing protein [Candidatus Competibacterales bacterium]
MPEVECATPTPAAPSVTAGALFPGRLEGVVYAVKGQRLVDDVTLEIPPHSSTVILGPNGAGKSLTLRLLHGLLLPTGGRVTWGGRPLDDATGRRQAMVFQRPVLLRRTLAANVDYALGLRVGSAKARRRRRDACLAQAGLEALARRPARRLSGGEQQRLALARALALEPEVLFLDEPTASLDPASVVAIEGAIHRAHRQGTTVVLVTDDLGQARRLAERVVFLHKGQVLEAGPAEAFFHRPQTAAARAFLAGQLVL